MISNDAIRVFFDSPFETNTEHFPLCFDFLDSHVGGLRDDVVRSLEAISS